MSLHPTAPRAANPAPRFVRYARLGLAVVASSVLLSALPACAPLVLGGVAATGVMVAVDRRTSGTQLEDETIELKAAARIRDALAERGHVSVNAYNRQVLLTGEVPTEQDKAMVAQIAAKVENVRAVVNELAVMPSTTLSQRSNDALVSGRVKAAIVDTKELSIHAFDVVTERGTVYLLGRATERETKLVTQVVRQVQGVQRVVRVLESMTEEELTRLQTQPKAQQPGVNTKK
jgi:osmotically-inducible protein OsmY